MKYQHHRILTTGRKHKLQQSFKLRDLSKSTFPWKLETMKTRTYDSHYLFYTYSKTQSVTPPVPCMESSVIIFPFQFVTRPGARGITRQWLIRSLIESYSCYIIPFMPPRMWDHSSCRRGCEHQLHKDCAEQWKQWLCEAARSRNSSANSLLDEERLDESLKPDLSSVTWGGCSGFTGGAPDRTSGGAPGKMDFVGLRKQSPVPKETPDLIIPVQTHPE